MRPDTTSYTLPNNPHSYFSILYQNIHRNPTEMNFQETFMLIQNLNRIRLASQLSFFKGNLYSGARRSSDLKGGNNTHLLLMAGGGA